MLCLVALCASPVAVSAETTPVERLTAEFGYSADALANVDDVRVAVAHVLDVRAEAAANLAKVQPTRARLRERVALLTEFAAETSLEDADRRFRVQRLAGALTQTAGTEANIASLEASEAATDVEAQLLGDLLTSLEQGATAEDVEAAEQQAVDETLAAEETQAKAAALEARRREEATKDAALRQLLARERELRDQLVTVATARRADSAVAQDFQRIADEFTATKGKILGDVDALPAEPTSQQREALVDPLLREILTQRRRLWPALASARARAKAATERVEKLEAALEAATAKVIAEEGRKQELGGSELWKQRVTVAKTEVELAQAQLEVATSQHKQEDDRVALLEEGVEFYSKEVRAVVGRASGSGRRLVYGLGNTDAWADAFARLNDKLELTRRLIAERVSSGRSLPDQMMAVGLWLAALLWRMFLGFVIPLIVVRLVPAFTRRLLSFAQEMKFFRRRPSLAVKLYELLRTSARPAILYFGTTYVIAYVVASFNELVFLQWAVDAFFFYFIGVRVATTLALPRWHREKEGMAATGGEDDLRPDEAAIADLLRLDLELGTKFVRSARIVLIVLTVWYFAPQIVVAITGVSVLSGLITNLTWVAIGLVVYWMLFSWKDELSRLFTKLAGQRLPKATAFVDRNKDRVWGVFVIGVVSVVVVADEIIKFVRRIVLSTEWFKVLSAYAFKTKIELQQRDEPTDDELSRFLPDDLEAAFSPREVCELDEFVERASMVELKTLVDSFIERGHGAVCIVGDPGVGKSTTASWLCEGRDVVTITLPHRISKSDELVPVFSTALGEEFGALEDVVAALSDRPSTTFVLDGLEGMFVRDIGGYGAYRRFLDAIHRTNRKHVWIVTVNRIAWEFLTRVYDQRHVFQSVTHIPRWGDEELRELVERRMAALPYTISFTELADADGFDSTEVVKTSRGYYRYLAEFTRGNPSTAMHYWMRSLSGGIDGVYSVGLFNRPAGTALVAAPSAYRFMLSAIAQHGALTAAEASRVDNTPLGTCELAAKYFVDAGSVYETDWGFRLTSVFLSVSLRHLEDSNLL